MTPEAREARNKYRREWYAKNKERAREYMANYWQRQAGSSKKVTPMAKKSFGKFIPLDVAVSGAEALLMCAEGGEQFDKEKIMDWFNKFYFEILMVSEEANHDAE